MRVKWIKKTKNKNKKKKRRRISNWKIKLLVSFSKKKHYPSSIFFHLPPITNKNSIFFLNYLNFGFRWFQGFDWDGLTGRTLSAPIVQPVRGPCDTANFDCFGRDNDIPPDEFTDWDIDF